MTSSAVLLSRPPRSLALAISSAQAPAQSFPATIQLADGSSSRMLVPVRYPGSERDSDDQLKLGRSTVWREEDGVVGGIGQRAFFAGDDLHYILSVREVRFRD